VRHDIWDYDAVNPVVLMDVRMGGRARKAIVEVGKTGWAYILDRETGKPLIGIDERPVPQEPRQATAKTQPFPRGDAIVPQFIEMAPEGHTLVNDGRIFTPFAGKDAVLVAPGIWGGASWPPSSYDPAQQRLFVCASSVINGYTGGGERTFAAPVDGNSFLGGATTFTRVARTGIIAAVDVTTNRLAWRFQWPEQCYSGTTATAGGLLFVGRNDGRLTALDSENGRQLWEFQTGAGMHAPAATFEHKGKQYVLAYSAGAALLGSARGDSVWLFGLDGTMGPVTAGAPVPRNAVTISEGRRPGTPVQTPEQLRAAADLDNGRRLYAQACAVCHGEDGTSGHGAAPSLATLSDLEAVMTVVTNGRNSMPSFRTGFTQEQIRDVGAYVAGGLSRRGAR
jgi:alcohol dehydrogenase (cytochrome c)